MTVEIQVDEARIEKRLAALAEIGGLPGGGMNRISYSPEDMEARFRFAEWLRERDLEVTIDAAGNVSGVWKGVDPEKPHILVGSHLDTQPGGGRFDGIAGVLAALEAVEGLQEAGARHERSIEIVAWAGEEASGRFDLALIGSRAMVGRLHPTDLDTKCRITGETLGSLMKACGLPIEELEAAERPEGSIQAVLELHIEQGPYLEAAGVPLGVVTRIAGNRRLSLNLVGTQAHSGAMPMPYRRDALCAQAEIILTAERLASDRIDPAVVATSGYSSHSPRMIAAIPGLAEMVIDVRSVDKSALLEVTEEISREAHRICERREVHLDGPQVWGVDPTETDAYVTSRLIESCKELQLSYKTMTSGAGHDSMMLGTRFPAGLLFVPSRHGISHSPDEFTATEYISVGIKVLAHSISRLAG